MSDVQRTSRIDAEELHLQALIPADVGGAVTRTAGGDLGDELLKPFRREPEVHVARSRGFGGCGSVRDADRPCEARGDLQRCLAQLACQLQTGGACVVAMRWILGPPQLEVGNLCDAELADGRLKRGGQAAPNAAVHNRRHQQVGCWPMRDSCTCEETPPRT